MRSRADEVPELRPGLERFLEKMIEKTVMMVKHRACEEVERASVLGTGCWHGHKTGNGRVYYAAAARCVWGKDGEDDILQSRAKIDKLRERGLPGNSNATVERIER